MKRLIFKSLLLLSLSFSLSEISFASTTWYVDGVNGSDANDCKSPMTACKSIGHAISLSASGDTIRIAAATYTENLTIGNSLNISGSGAATTIIDGGAVGRVVTIFSTSAHVTISGVTIRNGRAFSTTGAPLGGGLYNNGALTILNSVISGNISPQGGRGGGVYNDTAGKLTIRNTTVSGNTAWHGGGIDNLGIVMISSTTINGNFARSVSGPFGCCPGAGGGVLTAGTAVINNSTISGNGSAGGGGIGNSGTLTINSTTIAGNRANFPHCGGVCGGITLQNSIVANNIGGDCSGTMTSNGYNLSSDTTCDFTGPGDMNNINPLLGPLANNGGPTQTMALLPGSPAIDAGNPAGCTDGSGRPLRTDQRGFPRPDREDTSGCDMGAYESQRD